MAKARLWFRVRCLSASWIGFVSQCLFVPNCDGELFRLFPLSFPCPFPVLSCAAVVGPSEYLLPFFLSESVFPLLSLLFLPSCLSQVSTIAAPRRAAEYGWDLRKAQLSKFKLPSGLKAGATIDKGGAETKCHGLIWPVSRWLTARLLSKKQLDSSISSWSR